ncbi:MAG: tellurite resistance TerB family protein [Xanthomonadales bacterium]|nr:tellurite resistance TerB family protein [Xanthomonadales bacterium]
MQTSGFLDQLLRSARDMTDDLRGRADGLSERLQNQGVGGIKLGQFAQGALSGGALALLLGRRSGRKLAKWGGLAAIGTLAWRAWRQHQSGGGHFASIEPRTLDHLSGPELEVHSQAILVALISAAKADGHIDDRERSLIRDEVARIAHDPELERFVEAELARPVDPARVAALASSPELASEIYLATVLMVDEKGTMEKAYVDALAEGLRLDPGLRRSLDAQLDNGGS